MENPDSGSLCSPRGPGPVAPAGGGEAAPSSQPRASTGTGTQHSSPARPLPPGRDETLPFPIPSPAIRIAPLFADSCRLALTLGPSSCTRLHVPALTWSPPAGRTRPRPKNSLPAACCRAPLVPSLPARAVCSLPHCCHEVLVLAPTPRCGHACMHVCTLASHASPRSFSAVCFCPERSPFPLQTHAPALLLSCDTWKRGKRETRAF